MNNTGGSRGCQRGIVTQSGFEASASLDLLTSRFVMAGYEEAVGLTQSLYERLFEVRAPLPDLTIPPWKVTKLNDNAFLKRYLSFSGVYQFIEDPIG